MADQGSATEDAMEIVEEGEVESGEVTPSPEKELPFLPGFPSLQEYSKALISQVIAATKASNRLPGEGDDFEYYSSFPGFKTFCDKMGGRANRMISKLLRQQALPCHWPTSEGSDGVDERFDALEEANDAIIERVSLLLDEAAGLTRHQQPMLPNSEVQRGTAEVASWNSKRESVRNAVNSYSFIHAKIVERPQLKFKHQVDNSSFSFIPLLRHKPNAKVPLPEVFQRLKNPTTLSALIDNTKEWMSTNQANFHPYRHELDTLNYMDSQLELRELQNAGSLEDTPLSFVTTLEQLEELKNELMTVPEFAIDLEHHSYRSYTGFVCLMQVSTRCHDYLVDVLELRHHMHILLDPFTNPRIVKVLHGADMDIQWLQRDFGLYIVNMFDTGQASRALGLPRYSLAYLLQYCCGVEANKQFQLADWRIRPLPSEMVKYAREDTHYLLYVYDRMSNELIRRGNKRDNLVRLVLDNSQALCGMPYVKPTVTRDSYLKLYYKHKRHFNSQQLHCLQLIYKWRDDLARAEDESTGYVLPNHMLFQISEILPRDPQGVLACCNPIPTMLRQQVQEVNMQVQKARSTPLTSILPTVSGFSKEDETATPPRTEPPRPDSHCEVRRVRIKIHGPPVARAEPVLTAFKGEPVTVTKEMRDKCEEILLSFPNILSRFVEPQAMTRNQVFAMHSTAPELPPPVGEFPLNSTSLVATPPSAVEGKVKKSNGKKKKLSVREMGREDVESGGMESGGVEAMGGDESPPPKKKKKSTGKREAPEGELTPFQYEGSDYTKFAKQGREVKVFNPHDNSKESKRSSKSKVHQKFSERSQSWKKGEKKK